MKPATTHGHGVADCRSAASGNAVSRRRVPVCDPVTRGRAHVRQLSRRWADRRGSTPAPVGYSPSTVRERRRGRSSFLGRAVNPLGCHPAGSFRFSSSIAGSIFGRCNAVCVTDGGQTVSDNHGLAEHHCGAAFIRCLLNHVVEQFAVMMALVAELLSHSPPLTRAHARYARGYPRRL